MSLTNERSQVKKLTLKLSAWLKMFKESLFLD